jgi:hypothetical protein
LLFSDYFFSIPFAFLGGLLLKAHFDSVDEQDQIREMIRQKAALDVAAEANLLEPPAPRSLFTDEQKSTMLPSVTVRTPPSK